LLKLTVIPEFFGFRGKETVLFSPEKYVGSTAYKKHEEIASISLQYKEDPEHFPHEALIFLVLSCSENFGMTDYFVFYSRRII